MKRSEAVHEIVYSTSEPQDFVLENDEVAIDGTGLTVGLHIETHAGAAVLPEPTVAWLVQASGTVRVSGCDTLPVGRYKVRFSVENGSGDIGYFPRDGQPMVWKVVEL